MGTKIARGEHDCFHKALPDEPRFTLLGRDPLAGCLVSIWSSLRMGDLEAAERKLDRLFAIARRHYLATPDVEQGGEALDCAFAMFGWRERNDGRWRECQALDDPGPELTLPVALEAAMHALRSYQYGNASTEGARGPADAAEEALQRWQALGGLSAHADVDDGGRIIVHVLGSQDPGPMKRFSPLLSAALDEAHATELLGTLALAVEQTRTGTLS